MKIVTRVKKNLFTTKVAQHHTRYFGKQQEVKMTKQNRSNGKKTKTPAKMKPQKKTTKQN